MGAAVLRHSKLYECEDVPYCCKLEHSPPVNGEGEEQIPAEGIQGCCSLCVWESAGVGSWGRDDIGQWGMRVEEGSCRRCTSNWTSSGESTGR